MKPLILKDVMRNIDGETFKENVEDLQIKFVSTVSKIIQPNTLLFDFEKKQQKNVDHFKNNGPVIVVSKKPRRFRKVYPYIIPVKVNSIKKAYRKFLSYYRNLFDIPFVGITGTCGKTTTKDMITNILSVDHDVVSTYRNNNLLMHNLHYLMSVDNHTDAAVIEMPVGAPGQVTESLRYFKPQIRMILNIDINHLDFCKTPQKYLEAKAEMIKGMDKERDILILNGDDDNIKKIDVSHVKRKIYFGIGNDDADFNAKDITMMDEGIRFIIQYNGVSYPAYISGLGQHNVYNMLAAVAASVQMGIDIETAIIRLQDFIHLEGHMEIKDGLNGSTLIDDTWNNSPLGMRIALETLEKFKHSKKSVAILGYMGVMGDSQYAKNEYAKIGKKVVETELDVLIAPGEASKIIGEEAIKNGMNPENVYYCKSPKDVYNTLQALLDDQTILLLKYSRNAQPEFTQLTSTLSLIV